MKKKLLKIAVIIALAATCITLTTACKDKSDVKETETESQSTQAELSADEIRRELRSQCDGTYKDAKRIFDERYGNLEFRMEYFFTEYELNTIKILEDNGKNKVFYESYDKGWVAIVSLVGEAGDEKTFIGEQDPFVENFVWE